MSVGPESLWNPELINWPQMVPILALLVGTSTLLETLKRHPSKTDTGRPHLVHKLPREPQL